MASQSHQATLQDPGLRNWVRAGIGLKYTKEGLESFIDSEAVEFHKSLIKKLKHSTNLTSDLKNEIVSAHRFKGPSWKNSDQSKWRTDHWEVAKNYLPNTGGYINIPSAKDTDCSGLLNIGINLSEIATRHSIPSDKAGPTAFCKSRSIRNEILHCASQSLTDVELSKYLRVMKDTLLCTPALQNDAVAQQAVTKLTQLETSAFEITDENITEVRQMALLAIKNEGKEQVEAVRDEGIKQTQGITVVANKQREMVKTTAEVNMRVAIKKIQDKGDQQVEALNVVEEKLIKKVRNEGSSQVGAVKEEGEKQTHSLVKCSIQAKKSIALEGDKQREVIKTEVDVYRRVAADDIQDKGNKQVEAVNLAGENQIKNIKQTAATQEDTSYQEKNKLKCYIIETYIARLHPDTLPEVDRLYVQPSMELVLKGTSGGAVRIEKVFFQEQTRFTRIYISGDAGHGKTALCKMLVLAWCQEHSGKFISKYIPEGFLTIMKKFDFVFYITLRNVKKGWIISEIIKKQYFEDQNFFSKFMKKEGDKSSCLVILDGLDEWDPPTDYETPMHTTDGLPDLLHVARFTILTTTRPWKLEVLRLVEPEIDRQVRLLGFSWEESKMYVNDMVNLLNKPTKSRGYRFEFELYVKQLTHLQKIPILLKQLIMLWHYDEKEITRRTQIQLYSAMINHLLKVAWEKNKKKSLPVGVTHKSELPSCLREKQYCKIHKDLLVSLAHLAFTSSFKGNLVFDHVEATLENLNEDDIKSCLKAGLLCQEMYASPRDDEKKQLSFLHKSFQDFLAAVYLVMNPELPQTCNTMQKILDLRSLFIYVSGMDSTVMASLSHRIQAILDNDDKVKHCFSEMNLYPLKPIRDLFCECVKVSKENGQPLPRCHLEFIIIQELYYPEELDLDTDWENLESLIRILSESVSMKHVHIGYEEEDPVDSYLKCLKVVSRCKFVQNLSLYIPDPLPLDMEKLLHEAFYHNRSLSMLKLWGIGCSPFCKHLYLNRDITFVKIYISEVELSNRNEYLKMIESLGRGAQLKNLTLNEICLRGRTSDCKQLWQQKCLHHLDLSHCSQLQELRLISCQNTKVTINTTSLTYCKVSKLPVHFVPHVGSPIQKMYLSKIYCPHSLHEIATLLPNLTNLSHLNIDELDFGDEDVHLSPKSTFLEKVELKNIMMTGTAMNRFLASIPATCQRVDLEYDCVSDSCLDNHVNILSHLTRVTHLTLKFYEVYESDDEDDDDYLFPEQVSVKLTDRAVIKLLDSVLATDQKFYCEIQGYFNEAVMTHITSKFVVLKSDSDYGYPTLIFKSHQLP